MQISQRFMTLCGSIRPTTSGFSIHYSFSRFGVTRWFGYAEKNFAIHPYDPPFILKANTSNQFAIDSNSFPHLSQVDKLVGDVSLLDAPWTEN